MKTVNEKELKDLAKSAITHPIIKVGVGAAIIVALIYLAGKLMQLITQTVLAFKGLSGAIKSPIMKTTVAAK